MKPRTARQAACLLALLLSLLMLSGCAAGAEDPARPDWWEDGWFTMDDILAVEPGDAFRPGESNDALAPAGLYYATWVSGEGREIVNAAGDDATVYDVQIYLLVKVCDSGAQAEEELRDWMSREASNYETGDVFTQTLSDGHHEQAYRLLPLLAAGEDNPYRNGAAAFAVRDRLAISVELLGDYGDSEQAQSALLQFLSCIHYAE